jgi:phytoene dehydrogenase-like protein
MIDAVVIGAGPNGLVATPALHAVLHGITQRPFLPD